MITLPFENSELQKIKSSVTIGVFDGIHIGHEKILAECTKKAAVHDARSVVITFSSNPKINIGLQKPCPMLCSNSDFEEILFNAGIDYHCIIDFSEDMSKLTGKQFMDKLCSLYNVVSMTEGVSFRCGRSDSSFGVSEIGKYLETKSACSAFTVVPSVYYKKEEVSSTRVRMCLKKCDTDCVSILLGRRYSLDLRNVVPQIKGNRLFYKTGSVKQFLPGNGSYRVLASAGNAACVLNPDPSGVDTIAVISDKGLEFELPQFLIPDRIFFL